MSKSKKAYILSENTSGDCKVYFAESASKAKAIAWDFRDEWNLDYDYHTFIDFVSNISAKRFPKADSYYNGRCEMDWSNPNERYFLVKELGWACAEEEILECDCENCKAFDICQRKEEWEEAYKEWKANSSW